MVLKNIAVGISGGIDSAVAALLLKTNGFHVHGVYMKNWDELDENGYCTGEKDWIDAQWICKKLDIPLTQVNFVKEYWNDIFRNFLLDYQNGLTPNPDILCNKHIKFNYFYKYARKVLKADAISTGHYARSSFGQYLQNYSDGRNAKLLTAADEFKDQTFFLSQIPQESLQRTLFPLGNLKKFDVKEIARAHDLLRVVEKKESVGICFIGSREFKDFISEYIEAKTGNFVDIDTGKIVGIHNGLHNWTVGQGCKIGGCINPYFVVKKDLIANDILVAQGTNHKSLHTKILYTSKPYWIDQDPIKKFSFSCQFRFQHTKPLINCTVFRSKEELLIKLEEPLRAITPGQYAVFYKNNECLGNARIISPGPYLL